MSYISSLFSASCCNHRRTPCRVVVIICPTRSLTSHMGLVATAVIIRLIQATTGVAIHGASQCILPDSLRLPQITLVRNISTLGRKRWRPNCQDGATPQDTVEIADFDGFDHFTIPGSPREFQMAGDITGIHECAIMGISTLFMK